MLTDPETAARIRKIALDPFVTTPKEFSALIRADYAKYGGVVKSAGVKID
jgi:tripartite-type tricarboxylate transporter receptor subunit TctC